MPSRPRPRTPALAPITRHLTALLATLALVACNGHGDGGGGDEPPAAPHLLIAQATPLHHAGMLSLEQPPPQLARRQPDALSAQPYCLLTLPQLRHGNAGRYDLSVAFAADGSRVLAVSLFDRRDGWVVWRQQPQAGQPLGRVDRAQRHIALHGLRLDDGGQHGWSARLDARIHYPADSAGDTASSCG